MQAKPSQQAGRLTAELVDSFIRSIKAMHFVRMRRYLTTYGSSIVNRLQSRTRIPCIYQAIQLRDQNASFSCIKQLLPYKPNLHFQDTFGNTYLHHCCYSNNLLAFKLLCKKKLDITARNIYGQSVLFIIAKNNNQQILLYLIQQQKERNHRYSIVSVNEIDLFGRTPLFYSAEQGHLAICQILLTIGASTNIIDKEGHSVEFYAKKNSKFQVLEVISKYQKKQSPPNKPLQELITFNLTFLDDKHNPKNLTILQTLRFIEENKQLRALFANPEYIEEFEYKQDWKAHAQKAVKQCLLLEGSEYFSEPVIEECFGITDYYEVITNPIDFSTISKKLTYNAYERKEDFENDVMRIYENSVTYNGPDHFVTNLAINILDFFKSIWKF